MRRVGLDAYELEVAERRSTIDRVAQSVEHSSKKCMADVNTQRSAEGNCRIAITHATKLTEGHTCQAAPLDRDDFCGKRRAVTTSNLHCVSDSCLNALHLDAKAHKTGDAPCSTRGSSRAHSLKQRC